jgi:hypothetical protein
MAFHERKYRAYTILGKPSSGTPWAWAEWQTVAKMLQPVVDGCRAKPLLRSGQAEAGTKKWVKFGKLAWSDKHHEKWAHCSPITAVTSQQWNFFFTELAAPSLQASLRDGRPPDFFFTLTNEAFLRSERSVAFNPRFFFALASDMDDSMHQGLERAVRALAQRYEAVLAASIDRPWGKPFAGGFAHAIQDIAYNGLFKVGDPHSRPLTLDTLDEKWEEFG